jgi:DNA polymerase-3 subunit gamma/tau
VTQTLRNALREGRLAHAYLFTGPRGTGKTSTARILAKALNCTGPAAQRPCNECPTCRAITEGRMIDLIEIDAASNNSVDDIRELRERVGFRPSEGQFKIYIIDEVHMLSTSAFNALLKTLEEPPPHARFILATTEPHKIPATVISRCQRFDFRRIPAPEIAHHLAHIAHEEGVQAESDALLAIARSAQGCMRDAISLLDQMLAYGGDSVTLAQVQQVLGAVDSRAVAALVDALAARDVGRGLTLIHRLMTDGASLVEFCQQVVEHLRGVMVLQMTGDAALLDDLPGEAVQQLQQQARQLDLAGTLYAIKRFSEALPELKGGYQPQLPLEMALVEAVQGGAVAAPSAAVTVVASPAPLRVAQTAPGVETPQDTAVNPDAGSAPGKPKPAAIDAEGARRLQARWKDFLNVVKQQCGANIVAALNAVRDIAVTEHEVAFAFGNNEFSRNLVAKPDVLPKLAEVLTRYLGRPVTLECQMGEKASVAGKYVAPVELPANAADPLVEFAVADLGAEVVE